MKIEIVILFEKDLLIRLKSKLLKSILVLNLVVL